MQLIDELLLSAPIALVLSGWAGISVGLLVLMVLLSHASIESRRANYYLSGLVTVLILNILNKGLFAIEPSPTVHFITALNYSLLLCAGPCMYFYVQVLTGRGSARYSVNKSRKAQFSRHLHWLPTVAALLLLEGKFFFNLLQGAPLKLDLAESRWGLLIFALPLASSLLVYAWLSWRSLKRHSRQLTSHFSSLENTSLYWLKILTVLMFLTGLSFVVTQFYGEFIGRLPVYALTLSLYFIGLMGVRQPFLYTREKCNSVSIAQADDKPIEHTAPLKTEQLSAKAVAITPSKKKQTPPDKSSEQWIRLETLISEERPYLEPSLTLAQLANRAQLTPRHLSKLISSCEDCNFFDYINNYRVEQAKKLLSATDHTLSVTDIAIESGFNSRSPFYAQFKKRTGITPSEFRARNKPLR